MSAGLTVMSGTEYALAAGRLEEFSDMVRTLDAEADTQDAGRTGTAPAKTQTAPAKTQTTPAKTQTAPSQSKTAPIQSTTAPVQSTTAPVQSTTAPAKTGAASVQEKPASRRLSVIAGAAKRMEAAYTGVSQRTKETALPALPSDTAGESMAGKTGKTASGNATGRLSDFAALVKDAEAEAGITDSDPESEPVIDADSSDEEAWDTDEPLTGGGSRLEEFARLADSQGGDATDARLAEMAALSGQDSSEYVDDRIVALARVSEENEDEMEKKYGSRIEDNIVRSPSDYDDGDRVVTTANTGKESAARYQTSDRRGSSYSWRKGTDEKEQKAERIFGSVFDKLKSGRDSDDAAGESSYGTGRGSDDWNYMSGFFPGLKESIDSFESSDMEKLSLGTFTLTAYDACIQCCGKTDGITATRTRAQTGRTIAVDPNIIPYGSKVMINGHVYTAEDTGSAIKGKKIDIFMDTHEEATIFGLRHAEVFLVK